MVTRTRLRTILTAFGAYAVAGLVIAYFGMNAFSGSRGLRAKQDLAQQMTDLSAELAQLQAERKHWERRVNLLRPESLDPDMLDERARAMLDYVHPRDLVLNEKPPAPTPAKAAASATR